MNDIFDIINTIRLTEKGAILSDSLNKYVFSVKPSANKHQIKKAVETLFKKKVVSVNTSNYAGKNRPARQRRGGEGRTAHWKKAIVTLAPGEKIDVV